MAIIPGCLIAVLVTAAGLALGAVTLLPNLPGPSPFYVVGEALAAIALNAFVAYIVAKNDHKIMGYTILVAGIILSVLTAMLIGPPNLVEPGVAQKS